MKSDTITTTAIAKEDDRGLLGRYCTVMATLCLSDASYKEVLDAMQLYVINAMNEHELKDLDLVKALERLRRMYD